jgi:hypothetical protein
MQITRAADRTHKPEPVEWFTGEVDMLEIAGPGVLLVTFAPRAVIAQHLRTLRRHWLPGLPAAAPAPRAMRWRFRGSAD